MIVVPVAQMNAMNVTLGKLLAQRLGVPYPIPGTQVTGGIHGPGGQTLYASQPVLSADGSQVAFDIAPPQTASAVGKSINVGGGPVSVPASQVIDQATWAAPPSVVP